MGITYCNTNTIGTGGQLPVIIYINTTDDDATVGQPNYIVPLISQGYNFFNGQMALVNTSDGASFWDVVVTRVGRSVVYTLVINTDGAITGVTATAPVIASGGKTRNISLTNQGVGGSYINANVQCDQYGIITAISSGSSTSFPFSKITNSQSILANHGYFIDSVARLDLLLPSSFTVGDQIWIVSLNNSPWRITQNAGQKITYGVYASTVGVTGYVDSLGPDGVTNCGSVTLSASTANTVLTVSVAPSNTLNFQ